MASTVGLKHVLIVEDDVALARFLRRELERNNCSATTAHDAEVALNELGADHWDLMIMDLNLPKMDGMELLMRVRQLHPRVPVLVLTARSRAEDRVQALEGGANDCLSKPFSYKELLLRLGGLMRRETVTATTTRLGDLTINKDARRVMRGERRIDLTPREFAILEYLMENVGKAVSRAALMRDVWNLPLDATTNIVDVYMKYVRDKVDYEGAPKLIRTVRGVGYVLGGE
ncbi:response regulator [Granulicella sp. 5B5]|uniref:response regulator transcription factor n=1 Tax=Granulicella sp. 5B5 TaxID=1617967 RepID=UPI0015F53B07|nr:response regulator transcription factor [Granulicella sp. 5B5]QMV17531.1 response regulator [Granulicella sp. 5B5]